MLLLCVGAASGASASAAGTGLGEAILFLEWKPIPSCTFCCAERKAEGTPDFAPRTEKEIELLRFLQKSHPQVSFELIVSGRGFRTLHEFLNHPSVRHPSFDEPGADPAPEITRLGLEGSCPVCVETLDLFTTLYGAEAGNLALKALARGGVFVAGGIAPKILPKMQKAAHFPARLSREKGKVRSLVVSDSHPGRFERESPTAGRGRRSHPRPRQLILCGDGFCRAVL